jgi:hypothetical protein
MVTRTTRLKDFKTDEYPGSGLRVQALAEDHVGTYILPFPCERMNGEWRNATTGEAVEASIIGWREFRAGSGGTPFAQPSSEARKEPDYPDPTALVLALQATQT